MSRTAIITHLLKYALELIKLPKMSVSLILAIVIDKFLKRFFKARKADNHQIQNYMIMKRIIDEITHWIFIWRYQPSIEAYVSHGDDISSPNIM